MEIIMILIILNILTLIYLVYYIFLKERYYKDIIEDYQNLINQKNIENQKYKEVIDKAINNSQYWIDYYTRLNSDERIALRLQENIDILKEVK